MNKRIKLIYGLTICAIVALVAVQGYWLLSRYEQSLGECEKELYDTIVKSAEDDIKQRETFISPPRQTCSQLKVNYRQDKKGRYKEMEWSMHVFMVDETKLKLPSFNDSMHLDPEKYGARMFDYLSDLYKREKPDGLDFHDFYIGKDNRAMGASMEAIDRFYIDEWQPFSAARLDSILRARGVTVWSITTTKADSLVWQPSMEPHRSLWRPSVTVLFPYDIFEGQQAVVQVPISMSPVMRRMAYALLMTMLLSVLLVFCLIYQILTIRKQHHIEAIRQEFLDTMIHELKRPISTLKLCVSFMGNERMMADGEMRRQILGSSHHELDNLTAYFSKLRDITLGDADEIPLVMSEFPLHALLEECIEKQNVPPGKEVTMVIANKDNLVLRADRMHLANIVSNLLENAIKYSGENVTVRIGYRLCEDGQCLISVADDGNGIDKADQRYLFDKFYRSDTAKSKAIPGIGLGLSYVKLLVEAHGGSITFESSAGRGTTFTILLPQA